MERTYEFPFPLVWNSSNYGRALSQIVAEALIKSRVERDGETYNACLGLVRRSK